MSFDLDQKQVDELHPVIEIATEWKKEFSFSTKCLHDR